MHIPKINTSTSGIDYESLCPFLVKAGLSGKIEIESEFYILADKIMSSPLDCMYARPNEYSTWSAKIVRYSGSNKFYIEFNFSDYRMMFWYLAFPQVFEDYFKRKLEQIMRVEKNKILEAITNAVAIGVSYKFSESDVFVYEAIGKFKTIISLTTNCFAKRFALLRFVSGSQWDIYGVDGKQYMSQLRPYTKFLDNWHKSETKRNFINVMNLKQHRESIMREVTPFVQIRVPTQLKLISYA